MQALNSQGDMPAGGGGGVDVGAEYAHGGHVARKSMDEYREDHSGPGPGTLAKQNALHRSALNPQGIGGSPIPRGTDAVDDWGPTLLRTTAHHKQRSEQLAQGNGFSLSPSYRTGSPPSERTGLSFGISPSSPYDKGHSPYSPVLSNISGNPIEAVLPRPLLLHIIDLYFDYVYCLIPCLHKPSFMHDLHSHREERPGQDEWVALVFAVIEATLVQMPRSFVSLPKREIKILFSRANELVKTFLNRDFHHLSVSRNIILYFHAIAAQHMGNPFATDTIWGANYLLSIRLRLHEEASYQNLNPIERELRKRIFWLQYGGDKTLASIEGSPVLFHETDCADVTLPSPLSVLTRSSGA